MSLTSNISAKTCKSSVLKLSEPADSKTDPGFENLPRFEGVIGENKIQQTYNHNCIWSVL